MLTKQHCQAHQWRESNTVHLNTQMSCTITEVRQLLAHRNWLDVTEFRLNAALTGGEEEMTTRSFSRPDSAETPKTGRHTPAGKNSKCWAAQKSETKEQTVNLKLVFRYFYWPNKTKKEKGHKKWRKRFVVCLLSSSGKASDCSATGAERSTKWYYLHQWGDIGSFPVGTHDDAYC